MAQRRATAAHASTFGEKVERRKGGDNSGCPHGTRDEARRTKQGATLAIRIPHHPRWRRWRRGGPVARATSRSSSATGVVSFHHAPRWITCLVGHAQSGAPEGDRPRAVRGHDLVVAPVSLVEVVNPAGKMSQTLLRVRDGRAKRKCEKEVAKLAARGASKRCALWSVSLHVVGLVDGAH